MNQQLFPKLFGLIFLTIWGLAPEIALGQTDLGARPPLVVGITVDQMRADYLVRYWDDFGEGGFKRMVGEGFVCADHHFGYAPTYTGPGHASIFTGTTPQFHGIIGNNWYERSSGKSVYCAGDSNVYGVGPVDPAYYAGQMSPHRLRTSTLGDELKFALGMQPKVIGSASKTGAPSSPLATPPMRPTGFTAKTSVGSFPAPTT